MIPVRAASLVLASLVGSTGCWMSMPVLESSASPGMVPAVIAPESDAAVAVGEVDESLDDVDGGDPSALPEPSGQLEVEAELVEARSAPHCGKSKYVVVMRYAVKRVLAGTYDERDLYVAHMCPELGLPQCRGGKGERVRHFRAGEVHRLSLARGTGSGAIVDKFKDGDADELPRYRARCGALVAP
ncbi:hypothetical protein [Nannocystis sp. SCPEA4]|uniref:hypothetical protein n=1 Tax=Nannocystis sp. SCPEA4 TaxID=2996787 RepID=UPI00227205E9|nr:hypothetical protein [Nannocystis sp. SCPEA4]MCY1058665.1 hypothetical protein [Nannocystis sp. SCPEA4]